MCFEPSTPKDKQVACSHCGEIANPSPRWEYNWPNYGKICLGKDSCALDFLWNEKNLGFNHPAMIESGYQEINFEWGNGHTYDSKGRYRLCRKCQGELMRRIGNFFENDVVVEKVEKLEVY